MFSRGSFWVALGLASAGLGCTEQSTLPLAPVDQTAIKISKEPDLPKRKPQASTCVAFANASESAVADVPRSPAEQERLHDQARKAYQQALQIEPNNLEALTGLARLYNTTGDHSRAVATYQRAVQAHPRQASLWYELGLCHARNKEWDAALGSLQQAAQLEPEQKSYTRALGFCLARAGRYDESFEVFAKLDGEALAHYHVARMQHHLKQDELCKKHLKEALILKPDLTDARDLFWALENPGGQPVKPIAPAALDGLEEAKDQPVKPIAPDGLEEAKDQPVKPIAPDGLEEAKERTSDSPSPTGSSPE
jgi:tetratricopeptide (TPR) repeat protein